VQTPGGQIEYDGDAGTELTCIDVAMPMVIGRARDFGITGHEPRDVLDADVRLFQRIEKLRLEAGTLERPFPLTIEHPTGAIDVLLDADASAEFELHNAGLLRTARRLFKGEVSIPAAVW